MLEYLPTDPTRVSPHASLEALLRGTAPNGYEVYADNNRIARVAEASFDGISESFIPAVETFTAQANVYFARKQLPYNLEDKEVLERERNFYLKVYCAAMSMAERQPGDVALLFDVDETISEFTDAQGRRIGRPAFYAVLSELQVALGDRLRVGLLTTQSQDEIWHEVANPTYIKDVLHLNVPLMPELMFSTKDERLSDGSLVELPEAQDISKWSPAAYMDIVHPDVLKATSLGLVPKERINRWFHSKLVFLRDIARNNPDMGFVWIDDLNPARFVRPDHPNAMGVHVQDEVHYSSLRIRNKSLIKNPET